MADEPAVPQPTNTPENPAPAPENNGTAMSGHPAEGTAIGGDPNPAPTPAAAPEPKKTETVYVGNQAFELDPTAAQIVRAQQEMIQNMNYQQPTPQPAEEKKAENLGIDPDLIYTDPAEYTRQVMEKTAESVTTKLRGEYRQEQSWNKFYSDFYSKHSDLKNDDDLVKSELQANFNAWGNKPVAEVHDLLADKVRNRILGYVSRYGNGQKPNKDKSTVVESGQQQPVPQAPAASEETPKTATNILKMRRQKLRGAGG